MAFKPHGSTAFKHLHLIKVGNVCGETGKSLFLQGKVKNEKLRQISDT